MDKLKTLALKHGEKMVAGLFGLIGLMALTSASWSPNRQSPLALQKMTADKTAKIEQNQWPEEDQKEFDEIPDVESLVRDNSNILTRAENFTIGSMNPSILRLREKRSAVTVVPPEDGRAVAVVFPLAMPPDEEDADADDATDESGEEKEDEVLSEDEELQKLFEKKYGKAGGAGGMAAGGMGMGMGGMGMSGPGDGLTGMTGDMGGMGMAGMGMSGPGDGLVGMGGDAGMSGGYGMGGDGGYGGYGGSDLSGYGPGMMSVKKNIRVSAGVAVNMVVDLKKQRDILRNALHLSAGYQEAQAYIQYLDLSVERRQKDTETNQFGDWVEVTSEDLGEILEDSFGIDRDIVSPAVTRNTITMPLPRRAAGQWLPQEASHPRVENFELSPEEKELIDKYNQQVKTKMEQAKLDIPEEVKPAGFSQFTQTATDVGSMYGGPGMGGYGMEMMTGMEGGNYGSGGGAAYDYGGLESAMGGEGLSAEQKALLDETKATADHRLLLVRFMDFTIERGHTYEYRVRLVMKNPNYRHPLDELNDPGLSTEPSLVSDWSEPTPPVFVPLSHRIYLTDVRGRSGSPEKISATIYTDTAETGMPVMGGVDSLMGLPLAGRQTLDVVDLTSEELKLKEVTLATDELLAAAEETGRISSSEHREIKQAIDSNRGRVVPAQVCVVDSNGDLKLRLVGDNKSEMQMDELEAKKILELYASWKKDKRMDNNPFAMNGEGGGYGEGAEGGLGMGMGAGSAGGYYGGGGPGTMGGMPGMGPGGAGSGSDRSTRRGNRRGR